MIVIAKIVGVTEHSPIQDTDGAPNIDDIDLLVR